MDMFSSPTAPSPASPAWLRRLAVPEGPPPDRQTVIPRDVLSQACAARVLRAAAADDAQRLRADAQHTADRLLDDARAEARRLACAAALDAQRQVWAQATALLARLEDERLALREHAGQVLRTLLVQWGRRLLLELSEITPALSSVRLLIEAWGHERGMDGASLCMHPDDLLALTPLLATVPGWQVLPQPGLPRGDCVLVYGGLEMHASFTAHVAVLTTAVGSASPSRQQASATADDCTFPSPDRTQERTT